MANETTVQASCIEENHEANENIPPGVTAATSKLKVAQLCGDNEPLSNTFSTPVPTSCSGGIKSKSRLSGLQSALTPILKYLNIGNKCSSNCEKSSGGSGQLPNPDLSNSLSGRAEGDASAPVCWLADECLPEITLFDVTDTSMQRTKNDSALPDSVPSTPLPAGSMSKCISPQTSRQTLDPLQNNVRSSKVESEATGQTSSISKNNTETLLVMNHSRSDDNSGGSCDEKEVTFEQRSLQKSIGSNILGEVGSTVICPQDDTLNTKASFKQNGTLTVSETHSSDSHKTPVGKLSNPTPESIETPLRWLDDRFFPEITLLDVTRDSEFSPTGEVSSLDVTQDVSSVDSLQSNLPSSAFSEKKLSKSGTLDTIQSEDLSSTLDGNVTHAISSFSEQSDKCAGENTPEDSLGSVMEDSRSSSERSGLNVVPIQTSVQDSPDPHPANVTHDISSSSIMSVQCAASQSSDSNNVTSELHEPVVTSNSVEADKEELLTSHDAELSSKEQMLNPKTGGSVNGTFTIAEQSNLSASTNANTVAQIPCPRNMTLDPPPSNVNSSKVNNFENQASLVHKNTTETSVVINQNCSGVNQSGSCDVQNVTFDRLSLHKSTGDTIFGEAGATPLSIQSNTFDAKFPQNGTITISETSSSDSHHSTLDKLSPPKACNATSTPKDNISEVHPSEPSKHNGTTARTEPDVKTAVTPEGTFEANPAVEGASEAGRRETKDHSQLGLPMGNRLSYTLGHQSMEMEDNRANTLNLDDTLDLRVDALITSTPMTNCKMLDFHYEREEGKTIAAQKKLYGEGSCKPDARMPSDIPSNIVCDRKTFLTQPKSLLPPLKAVPQLYKYKPAAVLSRKFEPLTSVLPMTRQRAQAEALRDTAAPDALQATTDISSSYNLRATTTGSKQPNPGLRKPRFSSIPSGVQRAASGLKPPSAKNNAPNADKLRGPPATNPASKISQAKKHPLTRSEALPIAKKKKTDAPLPSGSSEASASSCDASNRTKALKQPTTTQRALPPKTLDAALPASFAEASTSCNAVSKVRALKLPATSHRALLPKPQGHGCAKCAMFEQKLVMKDEEIKRLKEELLKYRKPEEEC